MNLESPKNDHSGGIGDSTSRTSQTEKSLLADVGLLSVAVIWGVNMPVMKFALGHVDEYLFNALRLVLSSLTLAALIGFQSLTQRAGSGNVARTIPDVPAIRYWVSVVVFALFTGFAYQLLFLVGINMTSAGNTALIMSAIPAWTAVLALILLGERLSARSWTGLLVALAGVVIVTLSNGTTVSSGSLTGNLIVSAAAFSWAFGSVISRPIMKYVPPLTLAFWAVTLSVPLHLLVAGSAVWEIDQIFDEPRALAALFYSGFFSTGIAYALWNYGVQQVGAANAASFQNLVPLVALFASWWLISEQPFAMQLAGGALIIVGLVVMRKFRDNSP